MKPAKYPYDHDDHMVINGPRPSPLKINKESHLIQKPSFYSSSSNFSVGGSKQKQQQKNHPVIIYTHSPKVIHTQARDFMALVQKLTGHSSSSNGEIEEKRKKKKERCFTDKGSNLKRDFNDDNESSSSASTDENTGVGCGGGVSPILNPPKNNSLGDIPLFTPNSSMDLFCLPKPLNWYRYSDSPTMGNSISPSVLEFMKGVPEY